MIEFLANPLTTYLIAILAGAVAGALCTWMIMSKSRDKATAAMLRSSLERQQAFIKARQSTPARETIRPLRTVPADHHDGDTQTIPRYRPDDLPPAA